jgi:Flp pilus assembly protein TadB
MSGTKQALLLIASIVALIIAVLATYFVLAYPSILSVLLFVLVAPLFAILALGFFRIAREEFLKSKPGTEADSK